ncbi:anti-sigma factor [Methylibium sp. Pch-M]|uniref:anti-sigma factor family protein n=1 Tax=Methylibium sp. Pch-M TaxID=2082386 RepID=UPI001F5E19D1|nr:anti-sigma factor [Methylibium sp. Pch-M]
MDTRPGETELHAWVDGQLAPGRAAEVAQWLAAHPDEAARVAAWQAQRAGLQALHADLLAEPAPPHLTRALIAPPRRARRFEALAAGLLLALGALLGYGAAEWRRPPPEAAQVAAPGFVREAMAAHAVYVPDQRHPVEVDAAQQAHLVQWLSKRLGAPLRVPALDGEGLRLVGGRLLPGEAGQARAQFMYEDAQGQRVTLYVSVLGSAAAPGASAPAAFQWRGDGPTHSFYWVDGRQGYALSADLPRARLQALATAVYRQLEAPAAQPGARGNPQPVGPAH